MECVHFVHDVQLDCEDKGEMMSVSGISHKNMNKIIRILNLPARPSFSLLTGANRKLAVSLQGAGSEEEEEEEESVRIRLIILLYITEKV